MLRRVLSESCRRRTANPLLKFHFLGLLVHVLGGGLMLFLSRAFGHPSKLLEAAILQPVPGSAVKGASTVDTQNLA